MKRILLVLGFALYWLASSFATSPRETHELVCNAPQQIAATASQDGTNAKVFFSNTGATAYAIQYRLGYDSVWTSLDNVVVSELYLKELKPCAWYVLRVKSVCSPNESSDWRTTEFKTGGCTSACPKPAGLFASARDSIASLNWLATSTTAGYSVMWKPKRSTVWKTENVTTNTLILKGLLPCTEYEFKVKAMCGLTGSSEYSEPKSFKTLGCVAPCVTPREVKGEGGEGKIGIVWASTGARVYEIRYKAAADSGAWTSVRSTTNSLVISGLRSCAKYFIQVRSLCSGDNTTTILFSEWSSQIVIATTGCVTPNRCEPIRRLGFQPTANGAVLVWETVVGAKFEVQFKAKRDSVWKTVTTARSGYELTGLASCTEYQYRVRVFCANGGTSAWSHVMTFKTTGCPATCKAPKLVKTFAVDSIAVVTWAGEGATKFVLQYKVADAADWKTLNVTGNVYVLTGLKRCVTYYVRVKSVCSTSAMSDYTEIAKFTTGGCQPTTCVAPRELNGSADQTAAKFIWTSTSDRGYIFEYKEVANTTDRWNVDSVRASSTAIFNLKPCTKYVARVRSICVGGATSVSAPSPLFYFATTCPPNTCQAPLRGASQLIQDSTVYLTWSNTAAKYEVQYRITTANVDYVSVKTDTAFLKLALRGCQIYEWKVRAICPDGRVSEWSESRKFETLGCRPNPNVCAAPINLKNELAGVDSNQVAYFIWASSVITVAPQKYQIQYRIASSSPTTPWFADSVVGTAYKAAVKRCQIYEWRVRTICGNGLYSEWVYSKFETRCVVTTTCNAPTTGSSFILRDSTIYLKWGGSAATKYEVEVTNVNGLTKNIKVDSSTLLLALPACQVYAWRVRAICADGSVSAWSEHRKFETPCRPNVCSAPALPVIKATLDGVAYLYTDVIDSLVIQYRPVSDTAWKQIITVVTPNGVILRGLQLCTEYKVRVRRICPNGGIQWVETSFKVPGVNCFTGGNGTDVQGLVVRNVVKGLGISPNPGSEFVQVNYELSEPTDVTISLINLQGQVVSQYKGGTQDAGTYMQTLDNLSELNTGLYMLVIHANGKVSVSQKWMKQ